MTHDITWFIEKYICQVPRTDAIFVLDTIVERASHLLILEKVQYYEPINVEEKVDVRKGNHESRKSRSYS